MIEPTEIFKFERMLLHAILFQRKKPEMTIELSEILDLRNKQIYSAILECDNKGEIPDIVTVHTVDTNIDLSYLLELQSEPDTFNIEELALKIKFNARRREVNRILNEKLQNGNLDIQDIIFDLEKLDKTNENLTSEQLAAKVYDELLQRHYGDLKTFKSGFKALDVITGGFIGGEYIILAGRTSQGKTAAALSIIYNQCILKGHSGAFITVEMSDKQLVNRLITMKTGIPIGRLKTGDVTEWELAEIRDFLQEFTDSKVYISHASRLGVGELRRRVKKYVKMGAEFIVLDYIQKLIQKASTREQGISIISEACKSLAMQYDIPFIVLAQLNRAAEFMDVEPELSHLRESGSLEQDADMVIFVHRRKADDLGQDIMPARLLLKKNRNGATGTVDVDFHKSKALFTNRTF